MGAMKARGTTDMAAGLRMALDEAGRNLEKEGVNRIVLLGDGVPNDDAQINSLVAEASTRGISITTMGLGNDYDETLMGRIAQQSGGKFSYVEDSAKVASFFKEEVVRLHRVVAKNATLELRPGPGVTIQNVVGRQIYGVDAHAVGVNLGDLTYGEENEIIVELASTPAKDGATIEALDAVVRWQDGAGGASREERAFLGAKATTDQARIDKSKDQSVSDAVARAKDAAATLLKIEQQRNEDRAKSAPKPSPKSAKAGGAAFDFAPAAAAEAPMPRQSPSEVRQAHDQAMKNFQAH
jgi:Ca-activated chloride channel family protein